jgi:hypothetical protein
VSWVDSGNLNVKMSLKEKGVDNVNWIELAQNSSLWCGLC